MNVRTVVVATLLAATSTLAWAGESNGLAVTETSAGTGVYHVASLRPAGQDNAAEAPASTTVAMVPGASQSAVAVALRGQANRRVVAR